MIPGWEGRTAEEWARELDLEGLELHEELTSTNDRLKQLALGGAGSFTAVVADAQTQGRGRSGKVWHSPAGHGLWMSILIPKPPGGVPGVATLAVGVAAAEAVERIGGGRALLKWPNDLYLGDAKLGGVLTEVAPGGAGVVAGIGVNLRRDPAGYPAAGGAEVAVLEEHAGHPIWASELARALVERLRERADPPPNRLVGELRIAWERRDLLAGRAVQPAAGSPGLAAGVTEDGALRIATPAGGTVIVAAGSVRLAGEEDLLSRPGFP